QNDRIFKHQLQCKEMQQVIQQKDDEFAASVNMVIRTQEELANAEQKIGLQERDLKRAREQIAQQSQKLAQAEDLIEQQTERLAQAEEQIAEQQDELQQAEEDVNEKNETVDNLIDDLSRYVAGNVVKKAINTIEGDDSNCKTNGSDDDGSELFDKTIGKDEIYILPVEVETEGIKTASLKLQEEVNNDSNMEDHLSKEMADEAIKAATIELQKEFKVEERAKLKYCMENGSTVDDEEMIYILGENYETNALFEDSRNKIIQNASNDQQEELNIEENPMQEACIDIASNEGNNQTIEIDNGEGQIIDLSKQLANEAIEAATIELQKELEMEASTPQEQN
ncbi:MAG: hypothetical protein GY893_03540, partial [bacterium]|nr:hypothetical protein [bacterium]